MSGTLSVVGNNGIDFEYWFDQLIDHNNPSAGTFKQRYFFSDQYWTGDGAPIVLQTAGETSADGWWAQMQLGHLQNKIMGELGAAGVVLEHRYWGKSLPVPDLTTANLQWLTVEQSVEDLKYFAQNVQLPLNVTSTQPDSNPWINIGCGYSGILTAYAQEKHSDIFASAYASSAPVQADGDFWEYWEPVEQGMPWNCSSDLTTAMTYIDGILATGNSSEVKSLKGLFGLSSLKNDDFGRALTYPLTTWQQLQAYDYQQSGQALFFKFCDAIETRADGSINQSQQGVGMPQALNNWAAFYQTIGPDKDCPNTGGSCYSTYNYSTAFYNDTSFANPTRGWEWLLCTQLGFFQTGGNSQIVSRSLTTKSQNRQCAHLFPSPASGSSTNSSAYNVTASANALNLQYGGWNLMATNLFVTNGEFDPIRSASLSSRAAPGFVDTPTQDIYVIPNAHECWDWNLDNSAVNMDVMQAQELGISKIRGWLSGWYTAHPNVKNTIPPAPVDPDSAATITSLNNTILDMEGQIVKLRAQSQGAIVSYVLNGVFLLALLAAVGFLIRERSSRSPRRPHIRAAEPESQGQTTRLLSPPPRPMSAEQDTASWRASRVSEPLLPTERPPTNRYSLGAGSTSALFITGRHASFSFERP
ncbi:hypothetical protein FRC04_007081 [Tulasnella sp. 424]|nr:hypothetical protein FRC04_007081 [Tulasnella sp. 424]KAG8976897.1 hypothetical protein FRC05_002834 [Tulasnella sp. 425]